MAARKVNTKIFAYNVKLQSNERSGAEAYMELFKTAFEKKIIGSPRYGNSMILRTQFETEIEGNKILYGKIARFTRLDSDEWIDLTSLEKSQYELPENMFPNLKETDYFFIPQAHRFCVRKKAGTVSVFQVEEFLKDTLRQCRNSTEQVDVYVEQSSETIEKILSAPAVKRVELEISYTNNDVGEEAEEYVDEILKEMNANKMKMVVTPDHNEELSLDNSFLRGAIELAKSNGIVVASIVNNQDKTEKVVTRDHPEEFLVSAENEDHLTQSVFQKIMSIFRA